MNEYFRRVGKTRSYVWRKLWENDGGDRDTTGVYPYNQYKYCGKKVNK